MANETLNQTVIRDENREPIWWGVSSVDGITLVPIQVDSSTGAIKVEDGVSTMPVMSAIPTTLPRDGNRVACVAGVDDSDIIIPISVNPDTGAVQVQTT